jgi:hypothetical protein
MEVFYPLQTIKSNKLISEENFIYGTDTISSREVPAEVLGGI